MSHLNEEELTDAFYARLRPLHLKECAECRAAFDRLKDILDSVRDYPVPARGPAYGAEVWTRLLPQLPPPKPRPAWLRWWTLAPALASLLLIAFLAGMLTERRQSQGFSAGERQRVLLAAMSRHLERSQIVLAQVANATPATLDLADEQDRARDLVEENRLLRQTAAHFGDARDTALLEELERVLLDIANSPRQLSAPELERLQSRIDGEGLLFKLRVTSSDDRFKGQKL
jgi:hypothetical protein